MKRIKTYLALLFASAGLLLLVGFGTQPVKLLNERPPLIDLDAAIEEAQFGQNGNESDTDGEDPSKTSSDKDRNKDIVIRVKCETIYYGERKCNDTADKEELSQLKAWINGDYKTGDVIALVDDYAESKTYKKVLELLKKLKAEKGYVYNAD